VATIAVEMTFDPEVETEPEFPPHLMTADRYERLVEVGGFGADDPVFLWNGRLVEKMPNGRPHSLTSMKLLYTLVRTIPDGWHAVHEVPLKIGMSSMPEPDLMVVRGDPDDYLDRSRTARDVAIVIEVSDSSVAQDSVTKLRAYAIDGVPVYWIANLPSRRIFVHSDPTGPAENPAYREHREFGVGDEIPLVLDGIEVGRVVVREILPREADRT